MHRIQPPSGPWEPASVDEVAELFGQVAEAWWIAGGYAIELAVGRPLREHGDIDVLLLRPDQLAVQRALPGWEWWAADPPGTLRRWLPGEILADAVHDVWCRPGPGAPWRIQAMLDQVDGREWVSRRNPAVRRPVDRTGAVSGAGIPFLRPEIQLYYKAKQPRPKDELDFAAALPLLSQPDRAWLASAIESTYGPHPWSSELRAGGPSSGLSVH